MEELRRPVITNKVQGFHVRMKQTFRQELKGGGRPSAGRDMKPGEVCTWSLAAPSGERRSPAQEKPGWA